MSIDPLELAYQLRQASPESRQLVQKVASLLLGVLNEGDSTELAAYADSVKLAAELVVEPESALQEIPATPEVLREDTPKMLENPTVLARPHHKTFGDLLAARRYASTGR